jgi:Transcriptional Coactivator p15 (PC4)
MSSTSHNTKRKAEDEEGNLFGDSSDEDTKPKEVKKSKSATGDEVYDIGSKKKVTVGSFKGMVLVNIREYYTDKNTGEEKPGSKGIALTVEQWNKFKAVVSTSQFAHILTLRILFC